MHTFEIYEEYYDWEVLHGDSEAEVHLLTYGLEDPPNHYQPGEPLIAKTYLEDVKKTRREYKRLLWMEMNKINGVPKPVTLYEEKMAYLFYLALPGVDAEIFFEGRSPEVIVSTLKQMGRYLSFLHKQNIEECPFVHTDEDIHTDLVFTHGDFRLANVIVNENYITGSVDMVGIGVRDRYYDLVTMALDIERVLGRDYVDHFLEGYRIREHLNQEKFDQFRTLIEKKQA